MMGSRCASLAQRTACSPMRVLLRGPVRPAGSVAAPDLRRRRHILRRVPAAASEATHASPRPSSTAAVPGRKRARTIGTGTTGTRDQRLYPNPPDRCTADSVGGEDCRGPHGAGPRGWERRQGKPSGFSQVTCRTGSALAAVPARPAPATRTRGSAPILTQSSISIDNLLQD